MPRIPTKTRIHPAFLRCDLDQPTCTESQVRDFPIKAVPVAQYQADKCHRSAGTMQGFFCMSATWIQTSLTGEHRLNVQQHHLRCPGPWQGTIVPGLTAE